MHQIKILNYQGNKSSLMPFIKDNINSHISPGDGICDIFSGSGSVSYYLKKDYKVIANDYEKYSSIISSALLNIPPKNELIKVQKTFLNRYESNYLILMSEETKVIAKEQELINSDEIDEIVHFYKSLPTIWNVDFPLITAENLKKNDEYNLFLRYYSGTYFSIKQSIQIDSVIKTIHEIDNIRTQDVLFSCLFYAMKESVFSKDGHMAQPLDIKKNTKRHNQQRKKNILTYFVSKLEEFIQYSPESQENIKHQVYNLEMTDLLRSDKLTSKNVKLIYADPPYTDMQYSRYYHLLNVAARYDYPEPTIFNGKYTKGLYTDGRNQSDLSKKSSAKKKLSELINFCYENDKILILSYAYPKDQVSQKIDRYTISIEELLIIAKKVFGTDKVRIEQKVYNHANHRNSQPKEVYEYLIICGVEATRSKYDMKNLKNEIKNMTPTTRNPVYDTHLYWSQKSYNIIDSLIRNLSSEGDIVFDPFMGSGVTVLQSVHNDINRIGIGCDVNEMSKFILSNIIDDIPNSDLKKIYHDFSIKLDSLDHYYKTFCQKCGQVGMISKVVFDKPERTINKITIKAISFNCPHCGKQVKEADEYDYEKILTVNKNENVVNTKLIQNSKIAVGKNDYISDIFTPRNFSVLNDIVGYINKSNNKNVLNYLLMSVLHLTKITDTHSNSQWPLWIPKKNCVEKNVLDLLRRKMKSHIKAKKYIHENYSNTKLISNFEELSVNDAMVLIKGSQNITELDIPDDSVSLIITDPPYLDQVLYSEYMQLYHPFIGLNFNLGDEIVVSPSPERRRNKESYFELLFEVFHMSKFKLKENHIMCLFFHDSNLDVWVKLMDILELNGFKFISLEHIKKNKTVKNILSPKKSLSGDAILFFENTRTPIPRIPTNVTIEEIEYSIYLEAKKLLEINGDLTTPELYDLGLMEMLIANGWLTKLSQNHKSLVEIFEEHFIWKKGTAKWHIQS